METRRNNPSPTYRLPFEILSLIFRYHVQTHTLDIFPGREVCISHVCSYWRGVALNSPFLWNEPPLDNPPWMQEMLTRSKMSGLTINADLTPSGQTPDMQIVIFDGLREVLQLHGSRIRHLSITNIPHSLRGILKELPVASPMLETIKFTSLYERWDRQSSRSIPVGVLANTERLHSVCLQDMDVQWNKLDLRNVVNLSLQSLPVGERISLADAINVFRNMPKLESLHIVDAFLRKDSIALAGTVNLSHLHTLSVQCAENELKAFFSCVKFPSTANLHVSFDSLEDDDIDFCQVLPVIANIYSDVPPGQEFHSINVVENLMKGHEVELLGNKGDETFSIKLVPDSTRDARQILYYILSTFRVDMIDHIKIEGGRSFAAFRTLSSLRNASSISIVQCASPTKLDKCLLSFYDTGQGEGRKATMYFPSLTSLRFDGVVMNEYSDEAITVNKLNHIFVQRRDHGFGIERLELERCSGLRKRDIARLKKVIGDVQWDRYSSRQRQPL